MLILRPLKSTREIRNSMMFMLQIIRLLRRKLFLTLKKRIQNYTHITKLLKITTTIALAYQFSESEMENMREVLFYKELLIHSVGLEEMRTELSF